MADFFIDRIIKDPNQGDMFATWKAMTRQLFKTYPTILVYHMVDEILQEAADEDYKWFKMPLNLKKTTKQKRKVRVGDSVTSKIVAGVSIIEIADRAGLKPLGKRLRICCFHADTNPSLSLNDEKGLFNCFGCGVKGNVVDFIYLFKKIKGLEIEDVI